MDRSKEVYKRKISFVIHDPQPKPVIETVFCFWNINRVSKSSKGFHILLRR